MRTGILASAVAALFVSLVMSGGAQADTTVYSFASPSSTSAWTVDRYPPASFLGGQTAPDSTPGVLEQNVLGSQFQGVGSFYDYQGESLAVNLSGPVQSVSINLYITTAMLTQSTAYANDVNVGMWTTGVDSTNSISAYPIIEFMNLNSASDTTHPGYSGIGFYTWDYDGNNNPAGDWFAADPPSTPGWYNLDTVLTVGTGLQYYVNGSLIGTYADTSTTSLQSVMLEDYNFGSNNQVYWNGLTTATTPEPISMIFFGTGLVAVGGYVSRRRMLRKA